MNEPLVLLVSPYLAFFALVAIGAGAGFVVCKAACVRHWFVTMLLVGVAGSWLGAELSVILGLAARGSIANLAGALVGSLVILWSWQKLHPE